MLVTTAVDVRIHITPPLVETYRLDSWAEIAAWRANASAYPTSVIGTHDAEMTDVEAADFASAIRSARALAKERYTTLRKATGHA